MERFNGVIDDSFYIDGGRKIETVNDIQVLDLKNRLLVETLPIEIINWASQDGRADIVQAVASMLGINQYSSYYINEPKLAESHAGLYYQSAVLCGHGHDLANGVDVKTGSLKEGDTGCAIGNTKNKSLLHVYICDTFRWKVTMTIKPIPVPGSEDSITIPITPEGKVWDEYEFADCFKKEDVGTQPDRHVTGVFVSKNLHNVRYVDDDKGSRYRLRPNTENIFEKIKNNELDLVAYYNGMVEYPIYLDRDYFNKTWKRKCETSINCITIESDGNFVEPKHKMGKLFPWFMLFCTPNTKLESFSDCCRFLSGELDQRNVQTLIRLIADGLINKTWIDFLKKTSDNR